MSAAFIYSPRFQEFSYGQEHPFQLLRYRLTYDLIEELGLLAPEGIEFCNCKPVTQEQLLPFHRLDYVQTLEEYSRSDSQRANFRYGLGDVENPVFKGLYHWACLACGATLEAARQVVQGPCRRAFSMAGGYHHAHAARAAGFSYLNDAVVAIHWLLQQGNRVVYLDLDAHHGDGVQEAFYTDPRVMTISLHESGKDFFPYSGFVEEMGAGAGYGYSVNVPLLPHADDLIWGQAFERVVLPLLSRFAPDVLVTQLGMDTLRTDPLTRLECTTDGFEKILRQLSAVDLPWVAIGGGGYQPVNVARGWALAWGVISNQQVPDLLPPGFCRLLEKLQLQPMRLRDLPHLAQPDDFARAEADLNRQVGFLERRLLPLHER